MNWLAEAATDNETGAMSSARIAVLVATFTLSACTLALTAMVWWKIDLVPVLVAFGTGLAGVAGGSYVSQKWAQGRSYAASPMRSAKAYGPEDY